MTDVIDAQALGHTRAARGQRGVQTGRDCQFATTIRLSIATQVLNISQFFTRVTPAPANALSCVLGKDECEP